MSNTTNYDLERPELGQHYDSWGPVVNENIDKIDSALHNVGTLQNSTSGMISNINQNQDTAELNFNNTTSDKNDLEDRIIAMEERGVFECDPGDFQSIIDQLMFLRKDIENQCKSVGRTSRIVTHVGNSFFGSRLPAAGVNFNDTVIFQDGTHDIWLHVEDGLINYLDKS